MKKIFVSFLLVIGLIVTPFVFADKVTLQTPYTNKTITIDIPADAGPDARAMLITVSQLYWGERYDLENTLARESQWNSMIDSLKTPIDNVSTQVKNLIKVYNTPILFAPFSLLGASYGLNGNIQMNAAVGTTILGKFSIMALVQFPTPTVGLMFGFKW